MGVGGDIRGLMAQKAEYLKQLDDVRSRRFVSGGQPNTRTPEDIEAHAASIESAIAQLDQAIEVANRESARDA